MHGFHAIVAFLCVRGVRDTQCGFSFCKEGGRACFPNQHIHRWAFDCELLCLASSMGMAVVEQAVDWEEIDGSS